MKRRQLLFAVGGALIGVPVIGTLIYDAISKSKNQTTYESAATQSPTSPSANNLAEANKDNNEISLETTEEPLLRFAAIADNGFGS
ncbi:MAG: metallophosphoesterase, partial [Pseudanabaena sp.]